MKYVKTALLPVCLIYVALGFGQPVNVDAVHKSNSGT